jgi:hypothetical protein
MKKLINLSIILVLLLTVSCSGQKDRPVNPVKYIDTGIDSDAWVTVPAGEFLKGQHRHKTMIEKPYEIMVTDVTNAQYAKYLNEALIKGSVKVDADTVKGYYPGEPFNGWKHEFKVLAVGYFHLDI